MYGGGTRRYGGAGRSSRYIVHALQTHYWALVLISPKHNLRTKTWWALFVD